MMAPRLPVEPACVLDPKGGGAHALDRARPGTRPRRRGAGGPGGGDADLPRARRADGDGDEAPLVQCPSAADDRRRRYGRPAGW